MKNFTLLALLTAGVFSAHAQTRFGITAGAGTELNSFNKRGKFFNQHIMPTYRGGVIADIHLAGRFYAQPQLLVSTKGSSSTTDWIENGEDARYKFKTHLTYLELPVNIVYKHPLGRGKLIAGAGGYVARGIGGNSKATNNNLGTGEISKYKWDIVYKKHVDLSASQPDGKATIYNHPIDVGLNFMAGYELKNGLAFNVLCSPGLTNTTPKTLILADGTTSPRYQTKNSYIGISISYLLPTRSTKA